MKYHNSKIISLDNVSVSYNIRNGFMKWDKFWAIKNATFSVFHGETLGILGENGAGKSTLLRLLAGIIKADKGKIEIDDCSISLLSLQVGFIPHLTGRQNIILSGMLLGLSKQEIIKKIDSIIMFSGLNEFIDQPVNTYSMGMRARLGFSTSIQINPDVILIDEVFSVGDSEFRGKSQKAIEDKIHQGKTIILVTHSITHAREYCDRIIWLHNGIVYQEYDKEQVINAYLQTKQIDS